MNEITTTPALNTYRLPVVAIVGQPNVGKSTLFNCLTQSRQALVADYPGVTRDRIYGQAEWDDRQFIVIDTGGIGLEADAFDTALGQQSRQALLDADHIIFLVDAQAGLSAADENIAREVRALNKPCHLVLNKIDGVNSDIAVGEFYALGLGEAHCIAAAQKRGIKSLVATLLAAFPEDEPTELNENESGIRVAFVGRPNVGKSTLVNRFLGEERVMVFDKPGTTLDSIAIPFTRDEQAYTLIDTAGMRRRARVKASIEKFSMVKTLQAINLAHVVLFLVDGQEGITDQDLHILGLILQAGKALVIVVNKWDGLNTDTKQQLRDEWRRRLSFVNFARIHCISALHGSGVGDLFGMIHEAYASATADLSTPKLTKLLESALTKHQPPLVHGRRIKLRFAHQGGKNPPRIIIHGNQVNAIPDHYKRFLSNYIQEKLKLIGTPLEIAFKSGKNPFAGRKNKLTDRQIKKRRRLMGFVKRKK